MSAPSRWIVRYWTAAVLLIGAAAPSWAQGNGQKRAPESIGDRKRPAASARTPATQSPGNPLPNQFSIVEMRTMNGGTAFERPFKPPIHLPRVNPAFHSPRLSPVFATRGPVVVTTINSSSINSAWHEPFVPHPNAWNPPVRNPFMANPLFVNPLQRPFLDPFNGPGLIVGARWGPRVFPPRGEDGTVADASRPRSLLDEMPETPAMTPTVYQPISGIVTLADGSTFYRAAGTGPVTELGNYSSGGGLGASLLGGNFFSPDPSSMGAFCEANGFLPYVW